MTDALNGALPLAVPEDHFSTSTRRYQIPAEFREMMCDVMANYGAAGFWKMQKVWLAIEGAKRRYHQAIAYSQAR